MDGDVEPEFSQIYITTHSPDVILEHLDMVTELISKNEEVCIFHDITVEAGFEGEEARTDAVNKISRNLPKLYVEGRTGQVHSESSFS